MKGCDATAVHGQDAELAVIETALLPPVVGNASVSGATVKLQPLPIGTLEIEPDVNP